MRGTLVAALGLEHIVAYIKDQDAVDIARAALSDPDPKEKP